MTRHRRHAVIDIPTPLSFFDNFLKVTINKAMKPPPVWLFMMGIKRWPVDCRLEGALMYEAFLYHQFIIMYGYYV